MGERRFDALMQCMLGVDNGADHVIFRTSVDAFPDISETLTRYVSHTMVPLAGILLLASCLPLDVGYLLGNAGEIVLAPLAPLVLFVASGCVVLSWYILRGIMWVVLIVVSPFGR